MNHDNKGVLAAASGGPTAEGSNPKLTLVASLCGTGSCPTVYTTDRGTLVVQGYTVRADQVDVDLPAGEQLVEIPMEILAAAFQAGE